MSRKKRRFINRVLFGFIILMALLTKIGQSVGDASAVSGSNMKMIVSGTVAIVGLIIVNFVIKKSD